MSRGKSTLRNCDRCGKEFSARLAALAKGHDHYCSVSCANSVRASKIRRRLTTAAYIRLNAKSLFKEDARRLADYKCQSCGKSQEENKRRLDVHRIKGDDEGGTYSFDNVEVLCRSCHSKKERGARPILPTLSESATMTEEKAAQIKNWASHHLGDSFVVAVVEDGRGFSVVIR